MAREPEPPRLDTTLRTLAKDAAATSSVQDNTDAPLYVTLPVSAIDALRAEVAHWRELVERLTGEEPYIDGHEEGSCWFCGTDAVGEHYPDCPWLAARKALEDANDK